MRIQLIVIELLFDCRACSNVTTKRLRIKYFYNAKCLFPIKLIVDYEVFLSKFAMAFSSTGGPLPSPIITITDVLGTSFTTTKTNPGPGG